MNWPFLLAAALVLGGGAPFHPPPRPAPAARPTWKDRFDELGQVRYVTAARVYLDRGSAAGLAIGASVTLERDGRPVARCRVEWISDASAACRGAPVARAGDYFHLPPPPPREAQPPPPRLPSEAELARRKAAVEGAALELVAFDPKKSSLASGRTGVVSARLSHNSFLVSASRDAAFHHEQLAVRLDGAELLPGLFAFGDVQVSQWFRPSAFQAPQTASTQVHLRWAELLYQREGLPFAVAGGRTRPGLVPGYFSFDGLSLRLGGPAAPHSVGVFLGTQPDPVTLAPSLDRPLVGLSYAGTFEGTAVRLIQPTASVAWTSSPELGSRLEAQAAVHAQGARVWDANAMVRLGVGELYAPGYLDEVRVDLGLRPGERVRLMASARYSGLDALALLEENRSLNSVHAQASADWAALPWLHLGAQGGASLRLASDLSRYWGQVQVGLPRLFADKGGLWATAQLERGWLSGLTLALRSTWRPHERVNLWARLSMTRDGAPLPEAPASQDLGLAAGAEASLTSWLTLGGTLTSRIELPPLQKLPDKRAPAPAALNASLELRGRW